MGRTRLSAGRMAREPVVPKPSPVIKSPPSTTNVVKPTPPSTTKVVEPTPTFPSQPPTSRPSNPDTKKLTPTFPSQPPTSRPSNPDTKKLTPTFPSQPPTSRPSNPDTKKLTPTFPSQPPTSRPSPKKLTPTFPSQPPNSRPSNPDTKNKANKPRPKPQPVLHRPPTRSLNKVGTPENPLTVDDPSSSDEPDSEQVASVENNSDFAVLDSPEPVHAPQTQEKQPKPLVTDQRKSSRRRAALPDFVSPAPKRKKPQLEFHAPSLPLAAQNRPQREKAAGNKKKTKQNIVPPSRSQREKASGNEKTKQSIVPPIRPRRKKAAENKKTKQNIVPSSRPLRKKAVENKKTKQNIDPSSRPGREKTAGNKKKAKHRVIDEIIEDVGPSHTSDDISSLHAKIDLLTKMVLENHTMLKDQQVHLTHLERMVQPILDRGI